MTPPVRWIIQTVLQLGGLYILLSSWDVTIDGCGWLRFVLGCVGLVIYSATASWQDRCSRAPNRTITPTTERTAT